MVRSPLVLVVVFASAAALAAEPGVPVSEPTTYALIALSESKTSSLEPQPQFDMPRLPAHPLRTSLTSAEVKAVGGGHVSPRMIRVALETESVASFPIDDAEPPSLSALPRTPPRLLSIRRDLDDDGGVFEPAGATHRTIRRSFEETSEFLPVSAARHLRSSLD